MSIFSSIYARFPIGTPDDGLTLAYWQNSFAFPHGPARLPPVPPVVIFFNEFAKESCTFRPAHEENVVAHEIPWPRRGFTSLREMTERTALACTVIAAAQRTRTPVMLLDDCGEGAALFTACFYLMTRNRMSLEAILGPLIISRDYLARQGTSLHKDDLLRLEKTEFGENSVPERSLACAMTIVNFNINTAVGKAHQDKHDAYVRTLMHRV